MSGHAPHKTNAKSPIEERGEMDSRREGKREGEGEEGKGKEREGKRSRTPLDVIYGFVDANSPEARAREIEMERERREKFNLARKNILFVSLRKKVLIRAAMGMSTKRNNGWGRRVRGETEPREGWREKESGRANLLSGE